VTNPNDSQVSDPGLTVLVTSLRFHGIAADPKQIAHQYGATPIGVSEMLRCAKRFGLKARAITTKWER
jgi:ATP-binding cassette, subfamily B, bacterial HlyB/CyaB